MAFAFGCGCHAETTEEMISSCKAISTAAVISGGLLAYRKISLPVFAGVPSQQSRQ